MTESMRLTNLCKITTRACTIIAPMVFQFYSAITGETSKLKSDSSVFTIADGIVQYLLVNHLFSASKFHNVVGEEDCNYVNILTAPFKVEDLVVPNDFCQIIDSVRTKIDLLSNEIDSELYKDLTVFIDPIDGTREFSTGLGEQCSICIGFSDHFGRPVAGVVYRPITDTYAAGAVSEQYTDSRLTDSPFTDSKELGVVTPKKPGFLTSNGGISPFISALISELDYVRVPSGGAGNKMLMLIEGKGDVYIQDRGVSRWDTSAAHAVLEAHGGILCKLTKFSQSKSLESYVYLKSEYNLDFEPNTANLTPYNCVDKSIIKKGETIKGNLNDFAPYSNLCGLFAVKAKNDEKELNKIYDAIQKCTQNTLPAYD